ncbi:hypothetical protein RintRC_5397 [Richelia intracellularis]|nr:hypothetical protein RintRC_5397 [Richelia intracellularis]
MPLFFYSSTLDLTFIGKFFLINHLNNEYKRLPETSETLIYIAMIRIMVRQLG